MTNFLNKALNCALACLTITSSRHPVPLGTLRRRSELIKTTVKAKCYANRRLECLLVVDELHNI